MTTCWVLTREINEYEQDGSYFEAVFLTKPSRQQLITCLVSMGLNDLLVDHLLIGGGRQGIEHTWYHLREVKVGVGQCS